MILQLAEEVTTNLDSVGFARISIGPRMTHHVWTVSELQVYVRMTTKVPSARVYLGSSPSAQNYLCGTVTGHRDTATDLQVVLRAGESLTVEWADGDPGAVARVMVRGSRETGQEGP